MPVAGTDLAWYLSAIGGSVGGAISGTLITNNVDNNLWPDLSPAELTAGGTRYKKVFVKNNHATDAWSKPVFWIYVPASGITEHIGLGFDDTDDDEPTAGSLTQWSANAILQAVSSAADTRGLTIWGVDGSGVPTSEGITLNGTTPVNSATTWSKIWAVKAASVSGSNTVTLKQGAGGTTRGTIATSNITSFVWVDASSKANGIRLPDLAASGRYGIWRRQVWAPGASGSTPNANQLKGQVA